MQFEDTIRRTKIVRRHQNDKTVFLGVHLFEAFDNSDVFRQCLLQIVRSLVADFHQQGSRLTIDEGIDALVHVVVTGNGPIESLSKRVECPQSGIVALGGDHLASTNQTSHFASQIISTANMPRKHRDGVQPQTINTHHSGVFVLVVDVGGDGTHTDAHRSDEHKTIELLPLFANIGTLYHLGTKFTLKRQGNILARLADLYDCYLHITSRLSLITYHLSFITYHLSLIVYYFPFGVITR